MTSEVLNTKLCELLGCKYPVIQTAMGWVADPRLTAATCNAGGFGFLAGATIPPEQMEADIIKTKELTDKPFGVNYHMYQPNAADIVAMVIRHGVRAVSYSRSPGPEFIRKLKDAGVVCMPTVGLPKHAIKAVELGADVVTVQGGEGGGHTGSVPTTLLVPQVIDAVGDKGVEERVESEVRDLLAQCGYDTEKVVFVRGSALRALKEPENPGATRCIDELLWALDEMVLPGPPEAKRTFLFPQSYGMSILYKKSHLCCSILNGASPLGCGSHQEQFPFSWVNAHGGNSPPPPHIPPLIPFLPLLPIGLPGRIDRGIPA